MISIIIPIFNSALFLERTYQSVLKQTHTDFEVIMVDDGSTDHSAKICNIYAENDKRFRYFLKQNSGVADARNLGLKKAKGSYISFLDSDDTYDPLFLEKLHNEIVNNNVAIAACNMYGISKDKKKISSHFGLREKNVIMSDSNFCLLQKFLGSASLCNKIYKREVFNNIKFPGGMLFEDNYVFHEIFGNSRYQISLIEDYLYYYHYNSESITRKKFSLQRYDDHVSGLVRRKEFFLKEKKMYQAAAQTESMILDYMIINYLNNKEVQKNRLTIEYFLKNLLKSNVNYKTKIIIFSKLILNIDLFKSKFTPTK